jgi:nitroreductase
VERNTSIVNGETIMAAIQLTDLEAGVRITPQSRILSQAAVAALGAPSLLNTQPWRWRIADDAAELRADRSRQVQSIDPDGRLLTIACGVALHHAATALTAMGWRARVDYQPDADEPDLLARIRLDGEQKPATSAVRLFRAMATRRSDRRSFADRPVPEPLLGQLRDAAEFAGGHLHLARPSDMVYVTVASGRAASVELADPRYQGDLVSWVSRERPTGDGVPVDTTVAAQARPVPIRDFRATSPETSTIHDQSLVVDRYARYLVLFTDGDQPLDWLHAGEALSATLLTATAAGLASSMISDLIEVGSARETLRRTLGGIGWPMIVVRVGYQSPDTAPIGTAPRRPPADIIAPTTKN